MGLERLLPDLGALVRSLLARFSAWLNADADTSIAWETGEDEEG
jgi:hypothetical protein